MKTIQAKVSPRGLSNIALYFDNSPLTVFRELLQNCRRSKAEVVWVNLMAAGTGTQVTIEDEGGGIEDAGVLIHLWDSGWDAETKGLETPAGLGFFTLAHLEDGVQVFSRDWVVNITKAVFSGLTGAEVYPSPEILGTKLVFRLPEALDYVTEALHAAAKHYPLPVYLNTLVPPVPREDFLSGAAYVMEHDGNRIGVFESPSRYRDEDINFHGVTLKGDLDSPEPAWSVKVDAVNNRILDLVLPARTTVAKNHKLDKLQALCRKAVYEHASIRGDHGLPYASWLEAGKLGIVLPEARNKLWLAMPDSVADSDLGWSGPVAEAYSELQKRLKQYAWERVAIEVEEGFMISGLSAAEVAVLHLSDGPVPILVKPESGMEGYSWYPDSRVTQVEQHVYISEEDVAFVHPDDSSLGMDQADVPSRIELDLTIVSGRDKKTSHLSIPTQLIIAAGETGEEGLQNNWIGTPTGLASMTVDTLASLFFYVGDDSDSDSYDTQRSYFDKMAEEVLIACTSGPEAAHKAVLQREINTWEARSSMKQLGWKGFTVRLDKDGYLAISKPIIKKTKPKK